MYLNTKLEEFETAKAASIERSNRYRKDTKQGMGFWRCGWANA